MSCLRPYPSKLAWAPNCDLDFRTPCFCICLREKTLHCTPLGEVVWFFFRQEERKEETAKVLFLLAFDYT